MALLHVGAGVGVGQVGGLAAKAVFGSSVSW
jgi:hypothetical protein